MCYDVSFDSKLETIEEYFPDLVRDDPQTELNFEMSLHFQAQDFKAQPVIYTGADNRPHLRLMQWSVVSNYVKDYQQYKIRRMTMGNARSERLFEKGSAWYKIKGNRCLVPVTGIYEHREIPGWKKKVPYYVTLKSQRMCFLPGLFDMWDYLDADGNRQTLWSYTLLTREANNVMRAIHNGGENAGRMPLFLPLELAREFIGPLSEDRYKAILDFEMPGEELEYRPVFTIRGKNTRADGKAKNEFYEWDNLPELNIF